MPREFQRIKNLPPYVFAEVNKIKAEARKAGKDIIDFGMGNPDSPTPQHIVDKLKEASSDPRTHRYSLSVGIPGLRKAKAAYYERRFGVTLDPETEVIVTIGSKEGLSSLATAISKPGDTIIVPNPHYPIHAFGFTIVGAKVKYINKNFSLTPKERDQDFLKQLKKIVEKSKTKPLAVIVNYPCNPTAETTTLAFYEELVDFCHYHDILIISDLAYNELYFDGNPPPSILQVKKARDIAIEFTTMSKTYSMAGWRVGFAVGNKDIIYALKRIKSYLDYGAFAPVQIAATAALNGPQKCVEDLRKLYKERRDVLVKGLNDAGWPVEAPPASMFVWAKIPDKFLHMGSVEFSKKLITDAEAAVAPGLGFGENGDEYVRIALIENLQRSKQAIRNIKHMIQKG
ncbi:MAG: aminotransferase class I/II-fold pyridoxal phosphate-dependent enzyme [Proteobacteria bacterium]|nr:aminotransferase class I/II-fold pyridoxal phosphate-dependent enzyme [Pseudomonadota bacterium]